MIDSADLVRIGALMTSLGELDTPRALRLLVDSDEHAAAIEELSRHCTLRHLAVLVFPDEVGDVLDLLRLCGLTVREPVPSTVVRARLAERHGRDPESLPVSILTARTATRELEVFVLPGLREDGIAARERHGEFETHIAFETSPDSLDTVRRLVSDRLALAPDGGGHNPFEQADQGGRSVFYYAAERNGRPAAAVGFHRLELFCGGHQVEVLDEHTGAATTDGLAQARLLELITGHWATQALFVMADSGLADALADGPMTGEQAASAVGYDPLAVTRLLRYLAGIGVVTAVGDRFAGSPVLDLLRGDNAFRDLTLMYGGEFFQAWGQFGHAVRTGGTAFGHVFGQEHFEYFQDRPELNDRFNRSMAATTREIASRIGDAFDFSATRRVVDIGGGDGTLLRAILDCSPTASGVLFDRKHVVAGETGVAPARMSLVEGDFFESVPAGADLYMLSRILHDWDDARCALLLDRCRAAMEPGTTLLAIERVLPDEFDDSASFAWDLQMLAITGGQERTRAEYSRLLSAAGFELKTITVIWHGLSSLVAKAV
ncbi:MAG: hypothetical protein JO345_23450 [Streptosporangiaceae bacterium]|nr:SAM-dependent methyltransferase [Pseudonocardiales bacterium]MBV9448855.1 hypothetical protein [Streptosporangiaceae bacterium]